MEYQRFAQNIQLIRRQLQLEYQIELVELLQWSNHKIAELESGCSPSINQLSQLESALGLDVMTLVNSTWSPLEFPIQLNNSTSEVAPETFLEIPLYQRKARASNFAAARPMQLKERHLAKLCVPKSFFENKPPDHLRAFEIEGNSMFPNFENGDVVIGQRLEVLSEFEEGKPHVLLLKDSSLFFKRLFRVNQSNKKIQLSCDNLLFTSLTLGTNLVAECWQVFFHLKKGEL